MEYTTRIVRSDEGLSKEKALLTLQEHPEFVLGTKIANIYNQGGRWVAKLLEPKIAKEDCECEGEGCANCEPEHKTAAEIDEISAGGPEMPELDESPLDEIEESEEEKHEEHEEGHEQSQEKKLKELEKKIDLLLDALGISEDEKKPELPVDSKGPADLPAAPAPKKGPKSEPLPPGSGAKLKPGEVPNKPGMTPVGAPAFASVRTASCEGNCEEGFCEHCDHNRKKAQSINPPTPSALGTNSTPTATGPAQNTCPMCGGPAGACNCGAHDRTGGPSGPVLSFTVSRKDNGRALTIRQAKAQLENNFEGFHVARIKREGDAIHARLVRHD